MVLGAAAVELYNYAPPSGIAGPGSRLPAIRFSVENVAMRRTVPVVILLAVSGSPAALAFNCSGISLPSSMVICSDPDLILLADQRQQIYSETRSRLAPDQRNALWEDQKAWVRSYASACGVPPDAAPPAPVPSSVIECFKRAAEARAAYLRSYGLAGDGANKVAGPSSPSAIDAKASDVEEIALVQSGRLFEIPVQINGAITLNFIIDSGASDVQIPFDVFSTLVRANAIASSDILGAQDYVLADGSKQKSPKFLIRELKIGKYVLRNVPGSVGSPSGSLLLGQSFLSHFDSWTLDNKRHVLKLVNKSTEPNGEVALSATGDAGPGPMASLSAPSIRQASPETALLCGKPVEYAAGQGASDTGFVGVWSGNWNNARHLCAGLIVQAVDSQGAADVIYVYGGSGLGWRQQHRVAMLSDGVLSFQDDQGSAFQFRPGGSTELDAIFIGRSGRLTGTFQRSR